MLRVMLPFFCVEAAETLNKKWLLPGGTLSLTGVCSGDEHFCGPMPSVPSLPMVTTVCSDSLDSGNQTLL